MQNNRQVGDAHETRTVFELEKLGYKVLARNFRCKIGEIDTLEGMKNLPANMKGVMIQLNIADDYFKAKSQVEKLERDMELKDRELYDLKHDLISNQIKTEGTDERIKELEAENRELLLNKVRLEAALEDALLDKMDSKK